jgi:hypothetical protein
VTSEIPEIRVTFSSGEDAGRIEGARTLDGSSKTLQRKKKGTDSRIAVINPFYSNSVVVTTNPQLPD